MKYLQKSFSVPVAGPSVTQEDWDRIFPPEPEWPPCPHCGKRAEQEVRNYNMDWHDGDVCCTACGKKIRDFDAG